MPPRIDSGRCPTGPGLSCSRETRPARSCSSRRCGCSTPTSAASRLELEHYDLSLENRRRTHNEVVLAAARAMREAGYGIKAATITPEGADDVGSPNKILREADRRQGDHPHRPPDPGRARRWRACTTRSSVVRMAVEDAYGAEERREPRERRRGRVPHRAGRTAPSAARSPSTRSAPPRACTRACTAGRSGPSAPLYEGMLKEEMDAAAARHPDVPYQPQLIDVTYAGLVGGVPPTRRS